MLLLVDIATSAKVSKEYLACELHITCAEFLYGLEAIPGV